MKKFKFVFFIFLGAIAFLGCEQQPTTGATTEKKTMEGRTSADVDYIERMVSRISKHVKISAEQVASIKEIGASYDFSNLSREEYIRKKKDFKERIYKEVLTEDQLKIITAEK